MNNQEGNGARGSQDRKMNVKFLEQDDSLDYCFTLTPAERIELMGECVLEAYAIDREQKVPRMQKVYRVIERETGYKDL